MQIENSVLKHFVKAIAEQGVSFFTCSPSLQPTPLLVVSSTVAEIDKAIREKAVEALKSSVHVCEVIDATPVPMILHCPECGRRHIDGGDWATKPHSVHACQECGLVWKPAVVNTVGVRFLPGMKDNV